MTKLKHFTMFVAVSIITGLVASGLIVPIAGVGTTAAATGISIFDSLPRELEERPLAQPSTLFTKDGKKIADVYWQNRKEVGLENVSEAMKHATLAIEDHRFYEHGPVDIEGISRAIVKNLVTGSLQGGSTLTQQYVKNVLIANSHAEGDDSTLQSARERSGTRGVARKLREMKLAVSVEEKYSKDEILERYLNINSYSGSPNVYGVEAAAQQYWGVDAKDLTVAQAATLAGIVRSPSRYNPQTNPDEVITRRNVVLAKMREYGYIDQADYKSAMKSALNLKTHSKPNGCQTADDVAYFCEFVQHEIKSDSAFGETEEDRINLLKRGGLKVVTTLDSKLQKKASEAVRNRLPVGDPSGARQALASVDVKTGGILAMAQNTEYGFKTDSAPGTTAVNFSVDTPQGGGGGFQPGSTWKPFVLATWLQDNRSLNDQVNGSGANYTGFSTSGCDGRNYAGNGYNPRNAGDSDGAGGSMSVLEATKRSVNKAYADMASQLNMCDIRDTAKKMGVHLGTGAELESQKLKDGTEQVLYPSSILGTVSVSPLTMAAAYTAFANHGQRCQSHGLASVKNSDGKSLEIGDADCQSVLDGKVADTVAYALSQTFNGGTTSGLKISEPAAAKTGTTNFEVGASWLAGFTRGISTAVWTGDPAGTRDWRENDKGRMPKIVYGDTISGPSWQEFMQYAAKNFETGEFPNTGGTPTRAGARKSSGDSERAGDVSGHDARSTEESRRADENSEAPELDGMK
ncbi:transglycosylase domain-containing protein [Brevibacterium sp. FAM 25378]|uniref:transglycosylase domain-containing protein n=1 Tax=unclassified Brevibacterium TaxID=2614124 RepID=UPI001F0F96A7|nr:transglycosylase domain-containing protein [Brevibacterium sp. S22]